MSVHVKSEWSTNEKGETTETQTWESFTGMPSAGGGAKNIRKSHADGKYTVTFDIPPQEQNPGNQGDEYSVEGSMSQEPIETHEKFQSIDAETWRKWNLYKNNPTDPELGNWKPEESAAATLAALYNKGITDYLVPRAVVRITKREGGPPNLGRLGKIGSPPGAPAVPGSTNWMLVGASGNRSAEDGKWTTSYEYMSSGPGGWDREVYG
jgi:hypothetical protein